MLMKSVNAAGRRSSGGDSGRLSGLQLLAETAVAVSVCEELRGGRCGHSDPASCFLAVKKRKPSLSKTHHSLLVQKPIKKSSPIKLVIKHKQPAAGAGLPSAFPPALDVAPISFILPPPPEAPIPPPSRVKRAALRPDSGRKELFPLSFRARVSAAVGDGSVTLGSKFTLAIRKTLTNTDLNRHHNRLSIPGKSTANEFLTSQEKAVLEKKGARIKLGVFLDPDFEITPEAYLADWPMRTNKIYALGGGWKSVLKKNEKEKLSLEEGVEIELWSFRTVTTGELCFAMVTADSRRRAAADDEKEAVGKDDEMEISRSHGNGGGVMETESPTKGSSSGTSSSGLTHEENNHVQLIGCSSSSSSELDLTLRL